MEPVTYEEAIKCEDADKWHGAMQEEYMSLLENDTWELVK